ncbi:MAG: 3'-5' exonuclease [Thermomicrobiales bacterium]|nr:3'-5' exonuclease [Thermomicrobiales bacterium]
MTGIAIPKATDRQSAILWAKTLIALDRMVFLDTETTGLGKTAEIVDLSIVAVDGTVLLNQLVRPVRPIPVDAMLIHGITNEHVADAPRWADVLEMARPLIHDRVVVAYNSSFDRGMIEQCCAAATVDLPAISWECAMRAYAAFRKDPRLPSQGYRWRPLHEAAESFRLSIPTHRALADAMACRGVVLGMAGV